MSDDANVLDLEKKIAADVASHIHYLSFGSEVHPADSLRWK